MSRHCVLRGGGGESGSCELMLSLLNLRSAPHTARASALLIWQTICNCLQNAKRLGTSGVAVHTRTIVRADMLQRI